MRPEPLDDPVHELKQRLADEIVEVMHGWTQWNAASLLNTDQPRVSDLRRGKLERFSLEQLMRMLARIDRRVDITIVLHDDDYFFRDTSVFSNAGRNSSYFDPGLHSTQPS